MKYPVTASVSVVLLLASFASGQNTNPVTFRLLVQGEIEETAATKAGFRTSNFRICHLGFNKYGASSGEKVVIQNGDFKYSEQAVRYFDWILGNSSAQNLDKRGQIKGDRRDEPHFFLPIWERPNQKYFSRLNPRSTA